jgi:pilus assembly protein CpaF
MKSGPGALAVDGGEQFPPLETLPDEMGSIEPAPGDAMSRLTDRINAPAESGGPKSEGFEASIHRIKEQVLPRLLERVDPEAAATLSKDELAEEFRPIIGEVLAELKINLNRREQFALGKGAGRRAARPRAARRAAQRPRSLRHHGERSQQTFIEKKGKLTLAPSSSATRSISSRSRSGS